MEFKQMECDECGKEMGSSTTVGLTKGVCNDCWDDMTEIPFDNYEESYINHEYDEFRDWDISG